MKSYTVQKGDSLWKIAKAHGVSLEAVIAANPDLSNPNSIQVGQVIKIPSANIVQSGLAAEELAPVVIEKNLTDVVEPPVQESVPAPAIPHPPTKPEVVVGHAIADITSPTTVAPKWGQMWKYVVKHQDTMWKIAKATGVTLDQLISANQQVVNPDQIQPGQVLNIPTGSWLSKEKLTMEKPIFQQPEVISSIPAEVPVMEMKPKFELPAMEFPKIPSMPNITVPSINVPINMPINNNDIIDQKTYNIGPVGNKPISAPTFTGPVQQGPVTQYAPAPVAAPVQAQSVPPMVQYVEHVPVHHHPHCVCKTVIHAPHCGCYPKHHHHHHKQGFLYHHHMLPEYYVQYTYVQPHAYPAPNVAAPVTSVQSPSYYGAQQAGAPGEFGPYSYQPYQPTNQTATIK